MNRRHFLGAAASMPWMIGAAWPRIAPAASAEVPVAKSQPPPAELNSFARFKKGQTFNESERFADTLTGRRSRRLTRWRRFNQQPTYHLNACFSADSRHLVLSTEFPEGGSALLRAEVATGDLHVLAILDRASGERFNGNNLSMVQASRWVAANPGRSLRLYHLLTGEERVLISSAGEGRSFGHPIGSVDGRQVFIPRYAPPVQIDGVSVRPVAHLQVDIATGKICELFQETRAQCNHVVPCPTDPDLLLIDRNWPPKFGAGGDSGKTSRVWLLHIKTQALTEIRPRDPNRFQIHSNWSHCGQYVYYHGVSRTHSDWKQNGHYVGVADRQGKIVWEGHFPSFHYGHICTHTRRRMIITDGLFTPDLITAVHWEERNTAGVPRLEILAQHGSDWSKGQQSHPHCHVSPDGQWLSYNRGEADRSDVCVVQL
jgi:hypothetical protein